MKNFKTSPWNFVVLDEARKIVTVSAQNSTPEKSKMIE